MNSMKRPGLGRGTNEEGAPTSPVPAAERKEGRTEVGGEDRCQAKLGEGGHRELGVVLFSYSSGG